MQRDERILQRKAKMTYKAVFGDAAKTADKKKQLEIHQLQQENGSSCC
jgi:hypothetical protein